MYNQKGPLTSMLEGMNVLVVSSKAEFAAAWTPLLTRLGASVSKRKSLQGASTIHAVVADPDNSANEPVIADARSRNVPVVTTAWIIESIIRGAREPYDKYGIFLPSEKTES